MTVVSYQDRNGLEKKMEAVYKIKECNDFSPSSLVETNKLFTQVVRSHERSITELIEDRGGKVLSVISQPISKRRYKRKTAKLIKRNEKILSSLPDEVEE